MLPSLFAGVSGIQALQKKFSVLSNNIANANTVGFKASRVSFQDLLYQTLRGASAPQADRGGMNPMQVGLGARISGVDTVWTPGTPQSTGVATDLMIEGEGLFVVSDGERRFYTRAGNFALDRDGTLVTPDGLKVLGWKPDAAGQIDSFRPIGALTIQPGSVIPPKATTEINLKGNLDSSVDIPDPTTIVTVSGDLETGQPASFHQTIYDDNGQPHDLVISFAPGTTDWTLGVTVDGAPASLTSSTVDLSSSPPSPSSVTASYGSGTFLIDLAGLKERAASVTGSQPDPAEEVVAVTGILGVVPVGPLSVSVTDSGLSTHSIDLSFTPVSNGTWEVQVSYDGTLAGRLTLRFDPATGDWISGGPFLVGEHDPGPPPVPFSLDFSGLQQMVRDISGNGSRRSPFVRTPAKPIYDSLGGRHDFFVEFKHLGESQWGWKLFVDGEDITVSGATVTADPPGSMLTFDGQGVLSGSSPRLIRVDGLDLQNGSDPLSFTVDMGALTGFIADTTVAIGHQDGYTTGTLERFGFDSSGIIEGFYSNGLRRSLGQVALAMFANPAGLEQAGRNLFTDSPNSGIADIGPAGTGGRGSILPTTLEMSNVDISHEFAELILTQRAFQANARIITISDEILQELVNLRR